MKYARLAQSGLVLAFGLTLLAGFQNCAPGFQIKSELNGLSSLSTSAPQLAIKITGDQKAYDSRTSITFQLHAEQYGLTVADISMFTSIRCTLDQGAPQECSTLAVSYLSLAEGPHTFTVRASTLSMGDFTDSVRWIVDTKAPAISLSSVPSVLSGNKSPTVQGQIADEDVAVKTECQLNQADFTSCSLPISYSNLADGKYALVIRATDHAGNQSVSNQISWQIDSSLPNVMFTSAPPALSNVKSRSVAFTASTQNGSALLTECSLDDAAFKACTSPLSTGDLAEGSHTFAVRAIGLDQTPSSALKTDWVVDFTPPQILLNSNIVGWPQTTATDLSSLQFMPVANDAYGVASVTCQLDTTAAQTCAAGLTLTDLANGSTHKLIITVTDKAGNSAQVAQSFSIYRVPPPPVTERHTVVVTSMSLRGVDGAVTPVSDYVCAIVDQGQVKCVDAAPITTSHPKQNPVIMPFGETKNIRSLLASAGNFPTLYAHLADYTVRAWDTTYVGAVYRNNKPVAGGFTGTADALPHTAVEPTGLGAVRFLDVHNFGACAIDMTDHVKCWGPDPFYYPTLPTPALGLPPHPRSVITNAYTALVQGDVNGAYFLIGLKQFGRFATCTDTQNLCSEMAGTVGNADRFVASAGYFGQPYYFDIFGQLQGGGTTPNDYTTPPTRTGVTMVESLESGMNVCMTTKTQGAYCIFSGNNKWLSILGSTDYVEIFASYNGQFVARDKQGRVFYQTFVEFGQPTWTTPPVVVGGF